MLIILIVIFVLLIIDPNISKTAIMESASLWLYSLIPVLFPSLVITEMMANERLLDKLCYALYKPFRFIFNINYPKSVYLILISIICGSPANANAIKLAYDNGDIDMDEAKSILYVFSSLSLSYSIYVLKIHKVNLLFYYCLTIVLSIMLMHLLNKAKDITTSYKNKIYNKRIKVFFKAIKASISTLFTVLGTITLFNILIAVFFKKDIFLYPYLEILGGIEYINKKGLGTIFLVSSLSFLSLSVHFQILSSDIDFSYTKFLIVRIIYSLLISLLFFIFGG